MTLVTHQTAILHVTEGGKIVSISEDAVHLLTTCSDVLHIDPEGLLRVPTQASFGACLRRACRESRAEVSLLEVHSDELDKTLTLHILPRPGMGATIVIFASGLGDVPAPQILTPREWDVLFLAAKGLRRDRMAFALGLSVATIDLHCANLRKKMGARTTAEAVAKALAQRDQFGPDARRKTGKSGH